MRGQPSVQDIVCALGEFESEDRVLIKCLPFRIPRTRGDISTDIQEQLGYVTCVRKICFCDVQITQEIGSLVQSMKLRQVRIVVAFFC